MRDGKTDFFGNVDRGQQRPLLVAGWAGGHRRAANSGKPFLQIATLEKGCHRLLDDAAPVALLGLKAFVVDLLEGVKVLIDQAPQIRRLRIAWTVQRRRFETRQGHEQHATSRPTVGNRKADSRSPAD
ncbi:MAG: hypothetical protein O3C40_16225 [Planctomycetota bacterium]|nr:hypothetical protein [Planctomycetota bacterium]